MPQPLPNDSWQFATLAITTSFQFKPFAFFSFCHFFLIFYLFLSVGVNLSAEFVFFSVETLIESPFTFLALVSSRLLRLLPRKYKNKMERRRKPCFLLVKEEHKITIIVLDVTAVTSSLNDQF